MKNHDIEARQQQSVHRYLLQRFADEFCDIQMALLKAAVFRDTKREIDSKEVRKILDRLSRAGKLNYRVIGKRGIYVMTEVYE